MRKIVIISFTIIAALAVLIESGIIDSLIVFLLSGSLPGTPIVISPTAMMIGLVAIAWLTLTRLTALGAINLFTMRRLVDRHTKRHQRMPKRRYSRI